MSGVAKAGLAVVVSIPALMVAAVLFSPLVVVAGYGLDALIGQLTGCSIGTVKAAISANSPVVQVAVLAGQWLLTLAYMIASLLWAMGLVLMSMSANEIAHNRALQFLKYSTVTLVALGVLIPIYSQGICLST